MGQCWEKGSKRTRETVAVCTNTITELIKTYTGLYQRLDDDLKGKWCLQNNVYIYDI